MTDRQDAHPDAPLRLWDAALRRDAALRNRRRIMLLIWVAGSVLSLVPLRVSVTPRFVWNASSSAPIGLYRVVPSSVVHDADWVIALPPKTVRELAARRRYLPLGVPLVKRIVAGPGEKVCAVGELILIDDKPIAIRRHDDLVGRPMPWWTGCIVLGAGRYLLMMTGVPTSFDGRYFGPTGASDIWGRGIPLWTR